MNKKLDDIYSSEKRFQSALKTLETCGICEENKQHIQKFVQSKRACGVKPIRLKKQVAVLRTFSQIVAKDLENVTKEDIELYLCELEKHNYSSWTKIDYKVVIKSFYKWLLGEDEVTPKLVSWIKNKEPRDCIMPEELLTEQDVLSAISVCQFVRDKAFIHLLYESGVRIGELLTLKIKHITFAEPISSILVNGKTGQRRVPIIKSVTPLKKWIEQHPYKDNPESLVWIKTNERISNLRVQGNRLPNSVLCYSAVKKLISVNFKIAKVTKKVNPHMFRHSRATFLAKHLTEAQLKQFFGWTQSSDMAARYVHLSGRDLDSIMLQINSAYH
ncbi:MAG: tyrosine-type recombinase/integrase [Candidatus Diapherotrites archaeon]|jgi:integrase/recombinase XerD|uniref:Tyrosine-type recombinase/integrase n=1 Tax=Candidatus Iainarchaeum sp. TaxID=3101447 RepID=A0A8T5GEA0_9ARCH|nr:tyrosine-type recombinase/integrase [Candidatus Diapherotrites archaeon]MBT7241544.1 tyrosine-type recombinase/integrase [Candidatus Diapherotrites archaeon]